MPSRSAIVVGAGLAGMSAAWRLQRAGWQVTVLEKEAQPAGRARTVRIPVSGGECVVDLGATVMLGSYDECLDIVRQVGMEGELERVGGHMAVPRDGRMHLLDLQHPIASFLATPLLASATKRSLLKLAMPLLRAGRHLNFQDLGGAAGLDNETLAAFCRRALPAEAYDLLLNPMLKFLYLHDGEQGSLIELLWWLKHLGLKPVYSLRGGTASLIDALARELDLRCETEVIAIEREGAGAAVTFEQKGRTERLVADRCLVTVPAPAAVAMGHSVLSAAHTEFLASRVYDPTTVVTFCTRQRPSLDALMIQVPDAIDRDLATLVFQHRVASGRAPAGCGIVNAYFLADWTRRHAGADDAMVVDAARAVVRQLVPEVDDCEAHHVHRWVHTAALTATGDCARIRDFVAGTDPVHPVQFVGDYLAQASLNVAATGASRVARAWIAGA